LKNRKFFRPRDIVCNRYPIYDENGKYLTDGLKSGFEFTDFSDLKQKLIELLGHKLYDHLYITEDGGVINGLCIGYVEPPKLNPKLIELGEKWMLENDEALRKLADT
jgi:hypothetical protein